MDHSVYKYNAFCLPGWTKSDSRVSAICVGSVFGIGFMSAFAAFIISLDLTMLKGIAKVIHKMLKKIWMKMKTSHQKPLKDEDLTEVVAMNDLSKELA